MSMDINEKKIHVFTWTIKNFSVLLMTETTICSPIFKAKSFNDTEWYLSLYPITFSCDGGYISCFLKRKKEEISFSIYSGFIIEVLNKNGSIVLPHKGENIFEKERCSGWIEFWIKKDELVKSTLFDDTLIIRLRIYRNLPEEILYSQNTRATKFKISNHFFQCVVKNFNSLTLHENLKIPCSGSSKLEIIIQIPEDEIKIYIKVNENFSSSHFISCNFILLDVDGKERVSKLDTQLFEDVKTWEFPSFIKKSPIEAEGDIYLKDGCFTLNCDVSVSDGSIVEDADEKSTVSILTEDLRRLYADKIHTDVKLKVGEEVFLAHKNILCARSSVFRAMFENDMAESQKGEVEILDLDAKTIDLFLEYIYTATVNDLDCKNALNLIMAAEKYHVMSLKNKCAHLLASVISDTNVCEILVTADLVQDDVLKASVLNFIKKQPKKVFNSDEWKNCVKTNLQLATETATAVAIFLADQAREPSNN